jgi:uncharacterized protein YggL (DUF469 family)
VRRVSAPCPTFGFVARIEQSQGAVGTGALVRALIAELLDSRGLQVDPGDRAHEYVITSEGAQATSADRDALIAWLASRPDVRTFEVGPLTDVKEMA